MPEHKHYYLYENVFIHQNYNTRKVQNFEVMSNNFQVQETYSKFEAHVTKLPHVFILFCLAVNAVTR